MTRGLGSALATVGLFFIACPPSAGTQPEPMLPQWQDGETSVYEIMRNDSVLYTSTTVLRFDEEFGVRVIEVTTVVEPIEAQQFFYDSSVAVFQREGLVPLRSYRLLETDIGVFDIVADYGAQPGRVLVAKQSIDGTEKQQLAMPRGALDNEMVAPFLRATPLVTGTGFELPTVVPIDLRLVNARVSVLGTKQVATALGNIICREVELDAPSKEIRYWIEIEEPHRLVGLRDPETEVEMLLVRYKPGGPESVPGPEGMP